MIYLDNAATTKTSVEFAMVSSYIMSSIPCNPSSAHRMGSASKEMLEHARSQAAQTINAESNQIIFTSGGSESNAFALNGWKSIYASSVEHHQIIMTPGINLLPVDTEGLVIEQELEKIPAGSLVSIQMVNNETGVWQDIKRLCEIVHAHGSYFHCDAVQAFPHFRINVKDLDVDFLSISGHKFGCAAGIGLLYAKDKTLLSPLIHNTQEFDLRGGTENVPYIFAMSGLMKDIALQDYEVLEQHYMDFEDYLTTYFTREGLDFRFNGTRITYAILSISFKGINALQLVEALDEQGVMVSTGSACASHETEPSHVLKAMHVPDEYINGTIRISFCPDTTMDEVKEAAEVIAACVKLLRAS